MEDEFIRSPSSNTPPEIQSRRDWLPYFKDCVGAIDETHIPVKVAKSVVARFRGRKHAPTHNVLAACSLDLKFTYVLAGWEGSASDSRVLANALSRRHNIQCPEGMDFSDSPISSDDRKAPKNQMWSEERDKVLIEALVMQANEGNKVDKGFKESAYVYAANVLNQQFNLSLRKDKILNRLKTLKKKYVALSDVLGTGGFSFNHASGRVDCADEDVWATYVQEHPEAASLRDKPTKMYSEMCIVFGNDNAIGQWAGGAKDLRARKSGNGEKDNYNAPIEIQEEFGEYFGAKKNTSMPSSSMHESSMPPKRREKWMNETDKRMKEGEIYKKKCSRYCIQHGKNCGCLTK